jgi:hypothetical protein
MKLELKNLAPYLSYGLQVEMKRLKHPRGSEIVELTLYNIQFFNFPAMYSIKPLLIPLSEFYRNIDGSGSMCEKTYNVCRLELQADLDLNIGDEVNFYLPIMDCYNTLNILFENHFDVFGLIDAGLALNKLEILNQKS